MRVGLLLDLLAKTPTFESVFGRLPARNDFNSRCFSWEVHEKVKNTSSDSSSGLGRLWRSGSRILDPVDDALTLGTAAQRVENGHNNSWLTGGPYNSLQFWSSFGSSFEAVSLRIFFANKKNARLVPARTVASNAFSPVRNSLRV